MPALHGSLISSISAKRTVNFGRAVYARVSGEWKDRCRINFHVLSIRLRASINPRLINKRARVVVDVVLPLLLFFPRPTPPRVTRELHIAFGARKSDVREKIFVKSRNTAKEAFPSPLNDVGIPTVFMRTSGALPISPGFNLRAIRGEIVPKKIPRMRYDRVKDADEKNHWNFNDFSSLPSLRG